MKAKIAIVLAVAVVAAVPTRARAQDAQKDAQTKLLSKRAAEADAYRRLGETIQGLEITSNTYVRDFVAESDEIRTEFDGFVRGVRFGKPQWDSEMSCTIEAEVTVAKVIEELKSIHSRHYKGDRLKAVDFDQITRHIDKSVIKCVGMGAPRSDLPPDVPGGAIPLPPGAPEPVIPALWKSIPPNERMMAARAAEVDAKRKLLERIKGLRVTSDTRVRDFVAESDTINTDARGILIGSRPVGKPYYHDDELIVEVTVQVPMETVITTIKSLHKRHYKGDRVTGMDIENIKRTVKSQTFEAVGMGVPRPSVIQSVSAVTGSPDWISKVITAEGSGVPPKEMSGPQAKLMAARAAELDAKRRLAEEVMGFQIESGTTVRDFVTERDEIETQLNSYIQGAYVKSTRYDAEGTATVVVEMPAAQVWEVVHTYVRLRKM